MADISEAEKDDKTTSRRLLKINKSVVLIIPFRIVNELGLCAGQLIKFSLDNNKIILEVAK